MGKSLNIGLAGAAAGEAIDGRVLTRNLSVHACGDAKQLGKLIRVAQVSRPPHSAPQA
jgi:hypothetical protein